MSLDRQLRLRHFTDEQIVPNITVKARILKAIDNNIMRLGSDIRYTQGKIITAEREIIDR